MSIHVVCEECGAKLCFDEEKAGRVLRCKKCGADVEVPDESTRRGIHWGVWVGIGGAVAAVLVVVIVLATKNNNRDQPKGPPEVVEQPGQGDEKKNVIGRVRTPEDDMTLEDRLREAKAHEEAVARKEKEELELFKRQADWSNRYREVIDERAEALRQLRGPFDDAMIKAASRASEARDEKSRVRLAEERNEFVRDQLKVSLSPEVREAALKYATERLELERGLVKKLAELKDSIPKGIAVGDRRTLGETMAAAEEGVRRMEATRMQLAALPMPKQPGPEPKKTVVAQKPKEKTPEVPDAKHPEFLGPAPANWSVQVDPPKDKLEYPKQLTYSLAGEPGKMLYPPGRTAFAGVGIGRGGIEGYSIVDLRTGNAVGRASGIDVRPEPQSVGGPALSADGTYLAMYDSIKKQVQIGNLKARKGAAILKYDGDSPALLFPTPTQVLALPTSGKKQAKLWELPGGKELRTFEIVESPSTESGRMCVSPGGRFLAVAAEGSTPHDMHFYDLTTGKKVGTFKGPGGGRNLEPWFTGAAFSPDGSEFAAFVAPVQVGMNAGEGMACWDVKTGRLTYYRILDRGEGQGMLMTIAGEPVQWFPDGKGWLLFQRHVVDREAGAVVQTLRAESDLTAHFGTKILDDRRVLICMGGKMRPLEVRRLAEKKK